MAAAAARALFPKLASLNFRQQAGTIDGTYHVLRPARAEKPAGRHGAILNLVAGVSRARKIQFLFFLDSYSTIPYEKLMYPDMLISQFLPQYDF